MFLEYFWLIVSISFSLGIVSANYFFVFLRGRGFLFFIIFCCFFVGIFIALNLKNILKRDQLALFFVFLSFLSLAFWRYLVSWPTINSFSIENYSNQTVSLIGSINSEVYFKNEQQKIKIKVLKIIKDKKEIKVVGNVLVTTTMYPLYSLGDILEINGKLVSGGFIDNFNYDLYLKRNNISLLVHHPNIEKIGVTKNNFFIKKIILRFKNIIISLFDLNLSLDSSSLAKAILLGDKSDLSLEQRQIFSQSGISHVVAISGLHISLLSSYLFSFLLFVGLNRKKSFYLVNSFLLLYLILIAWPASAIRACLMGFLSSLAIYLNRKSDISNILFFSSFVLIFSNPFLLLIDLGFQLSFLAVLGIIYVYPKLKEKSDIILKRNKFFKNNKKIFVKIFDIINITISAQITTAPILIKNFEQFSLVAPLSNFLILWTIPLIIIFLILASILSCVLPFFSFLFFLPVEILSKYLFFVSKNVLLIPKSFIDFNYWPFWFSLLYYGLIFYWLFRKTKK